MFKKLFILSCLTVISTFPLIAQTEISNGEILGNIEMGNFEITAIKDESTGCIHKTTVHTKNLFIVGEIVQLDKANINKPEVIKPNITERVFTDKGCTDNNGLNGLIPMTHEQFKENVAIIGFIERRINPNQHVREIQIADFSGLEIGNLKRFITYECEKFNDEGNGHDLIANDGIYTSMNLFNNKENQFQSINGIKFLSSNPIIDPSFLKVTELNTLITALNIERIATGGPGISIGVSCDWRWVDCPNTSWWNTSIFGEQCIEFYNCTSHIDFTWS